MIQELTQNLLIVHVSKLQTRNGLDNQGLYLKWLYTTFCISGNTCSFTLSPWLVQLLAKIKTLSVFSFHSVIAETCKNAGNDAFLKDDFVKAKNLYTEGIEVKCKDEDLNAKLYNNRASAHYHLGKVSFIIYRFSQG